MTVVTVKQNPEKEIPAEVLAEAIVAISEGVKKIRSGRLNERGLVVLLQDATKLPRDHIRYVLNALEQLETMYLKPKRKA